MLLTILNGNFQRRSTVAEFNGSAHICPSGDRSLFAFDSDSDSKQSEKIDLIAGLHSLPLSASPAGEPWGCGTG